MDDLVLQALQKWPQVPAVRGWLKLDPRGRWLIRQPADAATAGVATPHRQARFAPITNLQMIAFINRNYVVESRAPALIAPNPATDPKPWQAYFQNGPQRVYVNYALGPYVWRLDTEPTTGTQRLLAHTGQVGTSILACWLDAARHVWIETELGTGTLSDQDLATWSAHLDCAAPDWLEELLTATGPLTELAGAAPIAWLFNQQRYPVSLRLQGGR
ncbi:DUF2946 family protein [Parvibium lacunae]|nr:DUF2946 family protein [Parvibium lacunae]